MFQELKQLTGHTLIYGIGHVTARLVTFILLPVFTYYLTPQEYGIYSLFYIPISISIEIVVLGLNVALMRYYVLEKTIEGRKSIFSTVIWTTLIFSTVISAVLWIFSKDLVRLVVELPEPYPDWAVYIFKLCALTIWTDNLQKYPLIVLQGENRPLKFTIFRLLGVTTQVIATIIFLKMGRGLAGAFEATLLGSIVVLMLSIPTIISRLKPMIDRMMLKMLLEFGLPNIPNLLFVIVIELSDRKFLEIFRTADEVGIYSAGYKLGMFMAIVTMAFRFAWQPFFLSHSDRPDARALFSRVLTYYCLLAVWLWLFLVTYIDPLVKMEILGRSLIAKEYWDGLGVFPIILFAHIFNGMFSIFSVGIYLKKKTHVVAWITGAAAVVSVMGNFLLIRHFGMWAAAWMTVLAYLVMVLLLYYYVQKIYRIDYEWRRISQLAIIGVSLYIFNYALKQVNLGLLNYGLVVLFPIFLYYGNWFTAMEKSKFKTLLPYRRN